jgi:hypothetical protein
MTGILCSLPIIGAPTAPAPANPLSVARSTSSVSGSASTSTVTSSSVSATASGGTSPYTYKWLYVSGNRAISATSGNSRTTSFTRTNCSAGTSYAATWRCQATDAAGTVAYSGNVSITLTCTTSSGGGGGGGGGGTTSGGTFLGISDTTISAVGVASSKTATFTIRSDGTYSGGGTWNSDSTVGSSYEVKATVTSGAITSGTTGSWLSLSSDRSWALTDSDQDDVEVDATFTLQIRSAGTTTVLDSATITLQANALSTL